MIYKQYNISVPLTIIVSSLLVYERREHNEISKKLERGAEFLKTQQGTPKRGGTKNLTGELRFFYFRFLTFCYYCN